MSEIELSVGGTGLHHRRLAPLLLLAGALLLIVGSGMHPSSADPSQPQLAFAEYSADRFWVFSHLVQLAGVTAMFLGLAVLALRLPQPASAIILLLSVVNIAVASMLQAVDGIALKLLVDLWAAANEPERGFAFASALAVRQVEIGLASMFSLMGGLTSALAAVALANAKMFPRWTAAIGLAGGLATFAAGLIMASQGFSEFYMMVGMPASLTLVAWVAILGFIGLWRIGSARGEYET